MNNRFLGNAACLTKYDLLLKTAQSFGLPTWYITMLTEAEERNKGDRNATNYRLGSQNTELLGLMKDSFYGEESTINDVVDHLRHQQIQLKMTTVRNNQKAENYRIGYITFFNHKERSSYFEGVASLLDKSTRQIVLVDPDSGIMPSGKKLKAAKGNSHIAGVELKYLMDNISDDSIIMVSQQLNDYSYSHSARVKDLAVDVHPNIVFLIDEVIQYGVYFFTKNREYHDRVVGFLSDFLDQYRFVKSSERVMLITGNSDGVTIKTLGATPEATEQ